MVLVADGAAVCAEQTAPSNQARHGISAAFRKDDAFQNQPLDLFDNSGTRDNNEKRGLRGPAA